MSKADSYSERYRPDYDDAWDDPKNRFQETYDLLRPNSNEDHAERERLIDLHQQVAEYAWHNDYYNPETVPYQPVKLSKSNYEFHMTMLQYPGGFNFEAMDQKGEDYLWRTTRLPESSQTGEAYAVKRLINRKHNLYRKDSYLNPEKHQNNPTTDYSDHYRNVAENPSPIDEKHYQDTYLALMPNSDDAAQRERLINLHRSIDNLNYSHLKALTPQSYPDIAHELKEVANLDLTAIDDKASQYLHQAVRNIEYDQQEKEKINFILDLREAHYLDQYINARQEMFHTHVIPETIPGIDETTMNGYISGLKEFHDRHTAIDLHEEGASVADIAQTLNIDEEKVNNHLSNYKNSTKITAEERAALSHAADRLREGVDLPDNYDQDRIEAVIAYLDPDIDYNHYEWKRHSTDAGYVLSEYHQERLERASRMLKGNIPELANDDIRLAITGKVKILSEEDRSLEAMRDRFEINFQKKMEAWGYEQKIDLSVREYSKEEFDRKFNEVLEVWKANQNAEHDN